MSHLEYNATIEWLGKDGKLTGHSCNHIPDAYLSAQTDHNPMQLVQIVTYNVVQQTVKACYRVKTDSSTVHQSHDALSCTDQVLQNNLFHPR